MKKLLIVFAILLLAGAGYFTYDKWVKDANLSYWDFIPADAAVVAELEVAKDYKSIVALPYWQTISKVESIKNIEKGFQFLDSINGNGGFSAIFTDAPALITLQRVANTSLDALFVIDIQNISQNTFISAAIGNLRKAGYRIKVRNYNGYRISEISKGNQAFTCIFYKHFFLGSFTPYLIEDAIRTIESEEYPKFVQNKEGFASLPNNSSIALHVNFETFNNVLDAFQITKTDLGLAEGIFGVQIDSTLLQISGLAEQSEQWPYDTKTAPSTFEIAEIIPDNTAYLFHWIKDEEEPNWKKSAKVKKLIDSLDQAFDFNTKQIHDLVDQELAMIHLESVGKRDRKKLLVLEAADINGALDYFNQLTRRITIAQGDSVYFENYSANEIRYLPINNFPELLIGDFGKGFQQCFYVNIRNYLVFSNSLLGLKQLIQQIEEENTWQKSLISNQFLQQTNQTANFSIYANIPRSWNQISEQLNGKWQKNAKKYIANYTAFEWLCIQISNVDNKLFSSLTLSPPIKSKTAPESSQIKNGRRFVDRIISKPFLLRTHAHRDFDIMLQDSLGTVYYLDENQNAIWTIDSLEKITSNVYPLDYYKNGKLQYVFATEKSVHIIDRTGAYIPGFPKKLENNESITQLNLIDYDRTRNYRIAISTGDGSTYLTDKDLSPLDGWDPLEMGRLAITPLAHARLGRRDIMLTLLEGGKIDLRNRRGKTLGGFPFDTEQNLDNNYYFQQSNTLETSTLTVISKDGSIIELNLASDLIKKDQLIKNTSEAVFSIVPEHSQKSYVIVRQEGNKYDVLDESGNLLFNKNYLSEKSMIHQYYEFGAGRDLIIFIETESETLYIYDKTGSLVTGRPLKAGNEVSLLYSSANREVKIFSTWGSNLEVFSFTY